MMLTMNAVTRAEIASAVFFFLQWDKTIRMRGLVSGETERKRKTTIQRFVLWIRTARSIPHFLLTWVHITHDLFARSSSLRCGVFSRGLSRMSVAWRSTPNEIILSMWQDKLPGRRYVIKWGGATNQSWSFTFFFHCGWICFYFYGVLNECRFT